MADGILGLIIGVFLGAWLILSTSPVVGWYDMKNACEAELPRNQECVLVAQPGPIE